MAKLNINQNNFWEMRKVFHSRFTSFLPVNHFDTTHINEVKTMGVSDQELLKLLLNIEFVAGDELHKVKGVFDEAVLKLGSRISKRRKNQRYGEKPLPNPPVKFEDLISQGWLIESGGRVGFPEELRRTIYSQLSNNEPVRKIIYSSDNDRFKLRGDYKPSKGMKALARSLTKKRPSHIKLDCISIEWIFARLWDTKLLETTVFNRTEITEHFLNWLNIWTRFTISNLELRNKLSLETWSVFVSCALNLMASKSMFHDWEALRVSQTALSKLQYTGFRLLENLPNALIDRYQWVSQGGTGYLIVNYGETFGAYLFSLIRKEILQSSRLASTQFDQLMKLTTEHPYCLVILVHHAPQNPTLYADLLLHPATCTLACFLIAKWTFNDGGWYVEAQKSSSQVTKVLAFEDAMSILHFHLKSNQISATDFASLYRHVYDLVLNVRDSNSSLEILSLVRDLTLQLDAEFIKTIYSELLKFCKETKEPYAFVALLDFLNESGITEEIEPSEPVNFYLKEIFENADHYKIQGIDLRNAQTLVTLALKCDDRLSKRFFNAIDMYKWIKSEPTAESELYEYDRKVSRKIKLHISLLANAISTWKIGAPPEVLLKSLAKAIKSGSKNQKDEFKIDVFVPGPGIGFTLEEDQKVALYLANALIKAHSFNFEELLDAILEIEEPIVLASIISNTPSYINERIKKQLVMATPEVSPDVWTLPAMQIRVESLLNADLPEVAEKFMVAESAAKTWGKVEGREIASMRANLRAKLLRKDWQAIEDFQIPESLDASQKSAAADLLLFMRGLSQMVKNDGDLKIAESFFERLSATDKSNTAYSLNLFAIRVQQLIVPNNFVLLEGPSLIKAKRIMAETKRDVLPKIQLPEEKRILDTNFAFIQLAAGQNQEAFENLVKLKDDKADVKVEGLYAIALVRLSRVREAKAALLVAEKIYGNSDFLTDVRAEIDKYSIFSSKPTRDGDENLVVEIRQKLLELTRMTASIQAEVMHGSGEFDMYLLDLVRDSCTSLVSLVPEMRTLGMTHEDDLNSLLKHFLSPRLELVNWNVEDQSKGGYSASGNPGSRDIKINKGTVTLAVIEALIVDSIEKTNLNSHFKKLSGYSTCKNFFHVTYARCPKITDILTTLRDLCTNPPKGITYKNTVEFEDIDERPKGFRARYDLDGSEIIINFLVLNMDQSVQKNAAFEATQVLPTLKT